MDGWIEVFARRKINCKRGEVPSFTVLSIFAGSCTYFPRNINLLRAQNISRFFEQSPHY